MLSHRAVTTRSMAGLSGETIQATPLLRTRCSACKFLSFSAVEQTLPSFDRKAIRYCRRICSCHSLQDQPTSRSGFRSGRFNLSP